MKYRIFIVKILITVTALDFVLKPCADGKSDMTSVVSSDEL